MPDDETDRFIQGVADLIAEDEVAELLSVTVRGNSITVTKIETEMWVRYEKRPDNPHLIVTDIWAEPSPTAPDATKFRDQAFHLAVAKAKELGWLG
ncbi:MAG: hypothetical protein ACRECX_04960 [Methyloceanibacter sp.]|uniref:hypothetical protein n=1 Tax=Methyloceanibacter sp. TaxID=1965321 RepID=UPI003D6C990C